MGLRRAVRGRCSRPHDRLEEAVGARGRRRDAEMGVAREADVAVEVERSVKAPARLVRIVEHLLDEGATIVADHRKPDGAGWVVMADPEGNEFCVLTPR